MSLIAKIKFVCIFVNLLSNHRTEVTETLNYFSREHLEEEVQLFRARQDFFFSVDCEGLTWPGGVETSGELKDQCQQASAVKTTCRHGSTQTH